MLVYTHAVIILFSDVLRLLNGSPDVMLGQHIRPLARQIGRNLSRAEESSCKENGVLSFFGHGNPASEKWPLQWFGRGGIILRRGSQPPNQELDAWVRCGSTNFNPTIRRCHHSGPPGKVHRTQ